MRYIAADETGSPFDLARNFAEVLIKDGMIKEYKPPKPKSVPASFGVGRYIDRKPFIVAHCDSCKQVFRYEGENPHCMKVQHCKMTEHPPAEVIAEYLQARCQWKPQSTRPKYENRPAPIPNY